MNIHHGVRLAGFCPVRVILGVMGFLGMGGTPVMAQDYVVANDTNAAVVINASTLFTLATIPLPPASNYDVAVMPNQSLAFVARTGSIWVIDLTQHPAALAAGINPIVNPLVTSSFVEDLALTADGRFLVVSDGSVGSPIAVINTATRTVAGLYTFLPDHNSVEVCDDGSVLVTSFNARVIKRLTISAAGGLVDTGQSLALPIGGPNNVTCARGGTTGVVVNRGAGDLRTFLVNGMTLVSTQVLPGTGFGINVSISSDGTKVFGRRHVDFITAYNFNSTTGTIGAQLWSMNVGFRDTFFGVDQMALNPTGTRLFVSTANFVRALDTSTGAVIGSESILNPTGIALRRTARGPGDFDGDGKTDITVFRPSTGNWHTVRSSTGTPIAFNWGDSADRPLVGDFDGDGKTEVAVFRPSNGTWYIVPSTTGVPYGVAWGNSADITVPGDYDGDSRTDIAVFRPSNGTWYVVPSTTDVPYGFAWGNGADLPVPGDYDGDGKTDIAVFRPSNGTWYVMPSTTGVAYGFPWGNAADLPVPGDYDGDGRTDIAVFRPSNGVWYVVPSATGVAYGFAWGNGADTPVPGDYDGDGKTDIAVFRPSNGVWYVVPSTTGVAYGFAWGNSADVPLR